MQIGEAVGQRIRELRTLLGLTQDELARACQQAGMTEWRGNRIGQIESGAVAPTVVVLYALAAGFAAASGTATPLAALLPEDETELDIEIGREWNVPVSVLRRHLRGVKVAPPERDDSGDPRRSPGWGAADDLAVQELEASPEWVLAAGQRQWGRTATQERDRRAGSEATPQKRGRITRDLLSELRLLREYGGDELTIVPPSFAEPSK